MIGDVSCHRVVYDHKYGYGYQYVWQSVGIFAFQEDVVCVEDADDVDGDDGQNKLHQNEDGVKYCNSQS